MQLRSHEMSSQAGEARRSSSPTGLARSTQTAPEPVCQAPHFTFRASRFFALALLCLPLLASSAVAQPRVIFLVRHAERAATSGRVPPDTGLSAEGKIRADHLGQQLKDAGITAIFTTEYKRTQQTAAPLAHSLGIQPEIISAGDLRSLMAKIKNETGNVLVVGHSNTLPQIINALGVHARVVISEGDYDNLFIVVPDRKPELIHLHYR